MAEIYKDSTTWRQRMYYFLCEQVRPSKVEKLARMRSISAKVGESSTREPLKNNSEYERLRNELNQQSILAEYGIVLPLEEFKEVDRNRLN